jgi:hypothetical protein
MERHFFWRDLIWIVPLSLALGAALALVQSGDWLIGWLAFSGVLLAGSLALTVFWRWAGGQHALFWMIALALLLRLVSGIALYVFLPVYGYDNVEDQAGYVFTDAYRRDGQAWELANSDRPIWEAFDKQFYTDQYGGLLAFSALTYRYLSPDAHRPLLIALFGALVAALGVVFLWRAAKLAWGERVAAPAAWVFALYPESILQGSSQMREPFLITFVALALWGYVAWQESGNYRTWWWVVAALGGMLLVSPAIALVTLVVLGGWLWLSRQHRQIPWPVLLMAVVIFGIGLLLLAWGVSHSTSAGGDSLTGILLNWFGDSVKWTTYQLEHGSGWVQKLFGQMSVGAQLAFVVGYGLAQPVLPAAFIEPTTIVWRIIAVLRSLGWYLLIPWLLYGLLAAWQTPRESGRRLWLWLGAVVWLWILVSALRAGGDQWDNPRYRVILLAWQSLVAGYAWAWWRQHRDAWLPRLLALEVIFLAFFTQWYLSRYFHFGTQLPFWLMIALIAGIVVLVLVGGWLRDRWRGGKSRA